MSDDQNQGLQPVNPNWPDRESMKEIISGLKELGKEYLDNEKQNKAKEHEIEKEQVVIQSEHQKIGYKTEWKKFITLIIFFAFCILIASIVFLIKDLPPALNSIICFIAGYTAALVLSTNKRPKEKAQPFEE